MPGPGGWALDSLSAGCRVPHTLGRSCRTTVDHAIVLCFPPHPPPPPTTTTTKQVLWAFCVYLEAVSVLPQLRMMQRAKVVEKFTGHYVFMLGLSRFISCAHWILQVRAWRGCPRQAAAARLPVCVVGWWGGAVVVTLLLLCPLDHTGGPGWAARAVSAGGLWRGWQGGCRRGRVVVLLLLLWWCQGRWRVVLMLAAAAGAVVARCGVGEVGCGCCVHGR